VAHLTLNSDGRHHAVLNSLTVFTLISGLVSFALGLFIRSDAGSSQALAIVAAGAGLAALLVGLYTQMMSATREERVLIVTGIIAGFVGLALGLAHGGLAG
jgi:FtsH-binding integral membrane protein